jgi:hypothetical protein
MNKKRSPRLRDLMKVGVFNLSTKEKKALIELLLYTLPYSKRKKD